MEWCGKMVFPFQRAWTDAAARFRSRYRRTGLLMLHSEVEACEYQDVHIMWEMLHKTEAQLLRNHPVRSNNRPFWNVFGWARFTSCLGRSY